MAGRDEPVGDWRPDSDADIDFKSDLASSTLQRTSWTTTVSNCLARVVPPTHRQRMLLLISLCIISTMAIAVPSLAAARRTVLPGVPEVSAIAITNPSDTVPPANTLHPRHLESESPMPKRSTSSSDSGVPLPSTVFLSIPGMSFIFPTATETHKTTKTMTHTENDFPGTTRNRTNTSKGVGDMTASLSDSDDGVPSPTTAGGGDDSPTTSVSLTTTIVLVTEHRTGKPASTFKSSADRLGEAGVGWGLLVGGLVAMISAGFFGV